MARASAVTISSEDWLVKLLSISRVSTMRPRASLLALTLAERFALLRARLMSLTRSFNVLFGGVYSTGSVFGMGCRSVTVTVTAAPPSTLSWNWELGNSALLSLPSPGAAPSASSRNCAGLMTCSR